mmetsp:Transcript_54543/g.145655  ORF Transcript_54543/g.145655 Transcript_54543/m.145655 type:complete len:408 (-) Transcript_54543:540-1763(-)
MVPAAPGLQHELVVSRRSSLLIRGGLRLQSSKIRSDHLKHAQHTRALRLLSAVSALRRSRLVVEPLQHLQRLLHGSLSLLRILDGGRVLLVLLLALSGRLRPRVVQFLDLVLQASHILTQLGNRSSQLVDLRLQLLNTRLQLLTGQLVVMHLLVTPPVVLGLLRRLLLQTLDQIRDHLLHLGHRVASTLRRELSRNDTQVPAVQTRSSTLQEVEQALLLRSTEARRRLPLDERGPGLNQPVLRRVPRHRIRGEDLDRLAQGLHLLRPSFLTHLKLLRVLLALRVVVSQELNILVANSGGLRQLAISLRRRLVSRSTGRGLLPTNLLVELNLVRQIDHRQFVRMPAVRLLGVQLRLLLADLVLHVLQHLNDSSHVRVVGRNLRSTRVLQKTSLLGLRQHPPHLHPLPS